MKSIRDAITRVARQAQLVAASARDSRFLLSARVAVVQLGSLILRGYLRVLPTEEGRLLLLTTSIGAICGLTAVLFHLAIGVAERLFIERSLSASGHSWIVWTIVTPTLGALLCGIVLDRYLPEARGSGIPQVKVVYTIKSGRIRLRDALGKLGIATVQIGTGSSVGREGPTVYICAGIASALGRLFAISPVNLRRLIPVGAAAGIAAAFNAPIAAVTFTLEELVGALDQTMLAGIVVAAAFAAIIERTVLGGHPVFHVDHPYDLTHVSSVVTYVALGIAAAVVGTIFTRGLLAVRARFQRMTLLPRFAQPAVGGLVTGVLAVVALALLKTRGVTGDGYAALLEALDGKLAIEVLVVMCAFKIVSTISSYSSGGAGGIFAPALFIGAMLGGAFGTLDQWLLGHPDTQTGAFALVGMGAVFAAVIRAPITSILIIFEMTNGYGLILPLMISNMTAYFLARRWSPKPIYEALLEQDGITLPQQSAAIASLSGVRVKGAMTKSGIVTLSADASVRAALDETRGGFSCFPVLDGHSRLVGLISEARLRRRVAEGGGDETVRAQLTPREHLRAGQPLHDAIVRMNKLGVRQMAVVDADDPGRLVGMFAMSDVIRAHAEAEDDEDKSTTVGGGSR